MNAIRFLACLITACLLAAAHPSEKPSDEVLRRFADEFVKLTPGAKDFPDTFTMGGTEDVEKPAVKVTFKRPFAVAKYEVTQELYEAVVGSNPSRWKGPRNSVEMVTWDDAQEFCLKATTMLRERKLIAATEEVRLPSEAEWEYACRAGTTTAYCFGDKAAALTDYAWFDGNAKGNDPPVGKKKPNAWGLYDMHGYVWEWCADAWSNSHTGAAADGKARVDRREKKRVIRGGAWTENASACRSASRAGRDRTSASDAVGFRCVLAPVVE